MTSPPRPVSAPRSPRALALLFFVLESILDTRLQEQGAGIIPFEVAGTSSRAEEILADWGTTSSTARVQIWLDYPFLISVGIFVSLAVVAVADNLGVRGRLAAAAATIAWLPLVAAVADSVENAAMLVMIGGGTGQPVPGIGLGAASIKYVCGATATGYLLLGVLRWRRRREPARDA